MRQRTNYDKQPAIQVSADSSGCLNSWEAITEKLKGMVSGGGRKVVVVECYPGVDTGEIQTWLDGFATDSATAIPAEHALKSIAELDALLAPWLGDDPVFGMMTAWELGSFFDADKTAQIRGQIANARGVTVVYGTGAAFVAKQWDVLLYCDVTRWEIQRRQRMHRSGNIGANNTSASPAELYKRAYFIDWRAADAEKHRLHSSIDLYIDTNNAQGPALISGDNYRLALSVAARRPFRVVPFFDPGPWGGEWMRRHFDLPEEPPNFAWCFDCVPEENSLRFQFGDKFVETPALSLVHEHPREGPDDRNVATGGVRGFALPDDALVSVNPYVHLVAVHAHFGRSDFRDFQLGAPVGRTGGLRGLGDGWQSQRAGERHERRFHERSARER